LPRLFFWFPVLLLAQRSDSRSLDGRWTKKLIISCTVRV
jgi:hypothetical protein